MISMGTTATLLGDLWHLPDGNKFSNKICLGKRKIYFTCLCSIMCLLMYSWCMKWDGTHRNRITAILGYSVQTGNYSQRLPTLINCQYSLLYLLDKTVYPLAPARQRLLVTQDRFNFQCYILCILQLNLRTIHSHSMS